MASPFSPTATVSEVKRQKGMAKADRLMSHNGTVHESVR